MNETPEQLLAQANSLLRQGRIDEAIVAHERLLALRPELADSWFNLGYLQRCARQFEESLASYEQALRRGLSGAEEVHLNRAVILSEHLERSVEAETELRKAVALNPCFLPAWLNLGNLYEDLGDAAQARDAYQRALEIAPGNGRALARIAAIDLFRGQAVDAVPVLRAALAGPGVNGADAAEIGFALGTALDALGDYDSAFAAFETANRTARDAADPPIRYDRLAHERLIDALIAAFPQPPEASTSDDAPPIFICGLFRSGSTLAEHILARHPRVTAGGELDLIPQIVRQIPGYPGALPAIAGEQIDALRAAYLTTVGALHPQADVITDKRCDNFLHIGFIKLLFPGARIVHTRRMPLDNLLSIYFLYFHENISYGFDLDDTAHWYNQYERLMRHWRTLFPDDIQDLDYDDVVSDPRPEIERLLRFCGLDWDDACLAPATSKGAVRTASAWQVRQPLHDRSSGRWRNYAKHLERIRATVDPSAR